MAGDGSAFGEVWGVPTDEPLTASEMAARADAAQLREETMKIALRQDGADSRILAEWTATGLAGEMALPIRRQDVVLQVGDKVTFRSGEAGAVTEAHQFGGQPIWADIGDGRNSCFTLDGFYWETKNESSSDIVSVNGRPIIED